jgi:cytochrome c oxidase subunit II
MVVLMPPVFTRRSLLLALTGLFVSSTRARGGQAAQVVNIVVERFSFTPSEFKVKAGVPVEIRLRSDDTDHGFRILGTAINVTIPKRGKGVRTVTFEPPEAGRYVFECSKLCGAGHSFMRGTLIAE